MSYTAIYAATNNTLACLCSDLLRQLSNTFEARVQTDSPPVQAHLVRAEDKSAGSEEQPVEAMPSQLADGSQSAAQDARQDAAVIKSMCNLCLWLVFAACAPPTSTPTSMRFCCRILLSGQMPSRQAAVPSASTKVQQHLVRCVFSRVHACSCVRMHMHALIVQYV